MSLSQQQLDAMTTHAQCDAAVEERITLQKQMVGTLYPSILEAEIVQIRRRQHELQFGRTP